LSSWTTRHTCSEGLTEAAAWLAEAFGQIPGATVELMPFELKQGPRVPADTTVVQVLCRLEATVEPLTGLVMMGAHLDSMNAQGVGDLAIRAPGANDDASGIAAMLEVARIMAGRSRRHTMMFAAFSGEEQGLVGSTALAHRAKAEEWIVDALLNNDMIGNGRNAHGTHDDAQVRVFSEASAAHQSRELARWMEWLQRTEGERGHAVKLVFRHDRFARGGDHTPFNKAGFTAVRLTEMIEDYTHQHTPDDLSEFIDYAYLARNAGVNLLALDQLANAGSPPTEARIDRRQSHDTTLTWSTTPGVSYVVYWRDTASGRWEHAQSVGSVDRVTLEVDKDNTEFAVGAEGGIPTPAI
jgi:hypothetical protein